LRRRDPSLEVRCLPVPQTRAKHRLDPAAAGRTACDLHWQVQAWAAARPPLHARRHRDDRRLKDLHTRLHAADPQRVGDDQDAVYREYGIRRRSRRQYEVDHRIPLELGGSNSIRNLFGEAAAPKPGFHQKDVLENKLHSLVCSGDLNVRTAPKKIASNWLTAYRRYVAGS
jgi:hypothetical protein